MNESQPILVAVDFGAPSDRAFEVAVTLATRLRVPLEIVHIHPPPPSSFPEGDYIESAQELITQRVAAATERGVAARAHLQSETPVFGLLEAIERLKPMLVVVGSHGRGAIGRFLLGSVSSALAHRCPVPLVIVPAPARKAMAENTAWSCESCGHILVDGETTRSCAKCGAEPVRWIGAPLESAPVDSAEPAKGEATAPDLSSTQTRDPVSTFAIAPAGVEGYDVNPELRVRY
jgi:nucleotide-binding universal stress UspA family protein